MQYDDSANNFGLCSDLHRLLHKVRYEQDSFAHPFIRRCSSANAESAKDTLMRDLVPHSALGASSSGIVCELITRILFTLHY